MGVNWQTVKWLFWLTKGGLRLGKTLNLGRQNLYIDSGDLKFLTSIFGYDNSHVERFYSAKPQYVEPLLHMLGASSVDSMDASAYEKATISHDLNIPVPSRLHNSFDTVFDGGTLEHVFNFPEGLRSSMQMLKPGGSFLCHQCFNNMVGHGFYCFGPEVFYRAFSEENGFAIKNIRIFERYPRSYWHEFPDPATLKERTLLISFGLEVEILVHAVKVREAPIFEKWPQQSDYRQSWDKGVLGFGTKNTDRNSHDLNTPGFFGKLRSVALDLLRGRAMRSPILGLLGKYWLNACNFSLQAQRKITKVNDPLCGGSPPNL